MVLATSLLTADQRRQVRACVRRLGGTLADGPIARVTHVVMPTSESRLGRRTLKYAAGVLCGAWLVTFDWILHCERLGRWCDEAAYELLGDRCARGAPRHGRRRREHGDPPLLAGCCFVLDRRLFGGNVAKCRNLARVLRCGGATVAATRRDGAAAERYYVLGPDGASPPCRTLSWLLDCVSRGVVPPP